jgi:pyrroloquinoline quinone biosynthesis protein B
LFNASPDIRTQLGGFADMQPGRTVRDTAIRAIVLIDAQIDHTTGLMMLREHTRPLEVYCTGMVYQDLTGGYPLFRVLEHYCGVEWHAVPVDGEPFTIPEIGGLRFTAVPLRSEAPPYSPHRHAPHRGDTIGVRVEDINTRQILFYAPDLRARRTAPQRYLEDADLLLVDRTVWTDDELARHGISERRAREMGHLPLSGKAVCCPWDTAHRLRRDSANRWAMPTLRGYDTCPQYDPAHLALQYKMQKLGITRQH